MVTKEMMKNSMEATWRKRQWGLMLIGILICLVVIGIIWSQEEYVEAIVPVFGIILFVGMGIPFLFYLFQYFCLFIDYKNYDVYEVSLERPTTSFFYKRSVYYTVFFTTNNGQCITRTTKPIWSDSVFAPFGVAEYSNAKIKIAYNEDKDKIIVLG